MAAHVEVIGNRPALLASRRFIRNGLMARFKNDERGSILIFSLFLLVMMLMIAGMSVDLMRSETQRSRLQSTLDRAVLAGASLEQTLDSEEVVRDYFAKAGLSEFLTDVTVVEGSNSKTVNATAETAVNTYFMNMLGIDTLRAPAGGQAEESLKNIEISLVLDISGSMDSWSYSGNDKKINLLKDAAQDFVYLMQCNPDDSSGSSACTVETDTVSISLVPYAEQVLVGEDLFQQFNVTDEHNYSSCADFTQSDFSDADILLTDSLDRAAPIDARTNYRSSRSYSKSTYDYRRTCRTESYRKIVPLSNSYSALQTQIGQLQADGYTSIDMGMKWGTALLSPTFRPAVQLMTTGGLPSISNAFADRPYDYNERSMQKVIVLMTDGKNTTQYNVKDAYRTGLSPVYRDPDNGNLSAYRASTDKYYHYTKDTNFNWSSYDYYDDPDGGSNNNAEQLTYSEFWQDYNVDFYEEAFWFLPDAVDYTGNSTKNTRLSLICTAAKANNIEVFTIGFETSSGSNLIMQNCASSDGHHFDVNGDDIDDAFTSIAREIHELRLTL